MLIYDFEVFKHDWLVVIADLKNKTFIEIVNDKDLLSKFYTDHQYDIWAGFNNKNYDQYILKALLTGHDPFKVSQFIIADSGLGFNYSDDLKKINVYSYDIYNNLVHGLKFYEGSMGDSIEESNVPFDLDRKLTDSEIEDVLKYCRHDVEETVKVFFKKKEDFLAQCGLIKLTHPKYLQKTQTQMSSVMLRVDKGSQDNMDEFNIDVPSSLKLSKYSYVKDWYMDSSNRAYDKSLVTNVAGVSHTFAFGGLHGAIEKYHHKGQILLMDVASLYPSLMIHYDLLSRSVKHKEIYKDLRDKRIEYKKSHNPLQLPLKLVLNKTYGAMKDKNNPLYDPLMANKVCIYGQLLILDLIEKLEPYCKLLQTNTDGIFISYFDNDLETINDITKEWQSRVGLSLEFTDAEELWQKDVNNYVLKLSDGTLKTKGAYVKKLDSLDYGDYPIINKAIVEYLVNKTPIEDTINTNNNLIDFQMVCKITGKFNAIFHGDKKLNEKCVRVFASNDGSFGITKQHAETLVLHKISNTPEHVFIDNSDIKGKAIPENLDKNFYIDLAKKRIQEFI